MADAPAGIKGPPVGRLGEDGRRRATGRVVTAGRLPRRGRPLRPNAVG